MKLSTFYKLFYRHRFKKANLFLKFYLILIIYFKYLINLPFIPKKTNLDNEKFEFLFEKKDLTELFDYFNSDKGDFFENQYTHPIKRSKKKIKGHGYSKFYEKYFDKIKDKNINIIEIGSFYGNASAALFFYFKNAKLFAADIFPDLFSYKSSRLKNFYVDSSNENSIKKNIIQQIENNFDIIIEDAGHYLKDQIISLFLLFKKLNHGGLFIIEELDFPNKRKDMNFNNEKPTLRDILLNLKQKNVFLDSNYINEQDKKYFLENVESIEIFEGNFNEIAIIKKR